MMMYKKIIAAGLLWTALTASAGAFDYNQSVDEIAANPLTAYQTVYLGMREPTLTATSRFYRIGPSTAAPCPSRKKPNGRLS